MEESEGYYSDLVQPDHLYVQVPRPITVDMLGGILRDIIAELDLEAAERITTITIERTA